MTRPVCQLLVYFGTAPTASTQFTLNDSTKGVLDSATYLLSGDTGTDLTSYINHTSVRRGRTSQLLSDASAGQLSVQLNNESRMFDPLYAAGSLYGLLTPGRRCVLIVDGVTIYDGRVSDWDLDYAVSGRSTATLSGEDALASLSRQQFLAWTTSAAQAPGARLTAVLNRSEVAWPGGQRDLDTGFASLQADNVSDQSNVLNYCQLVARSDGPATFFASRKGLLTFRDRRANLTSTPVVTFTDDGTGVAFQDVQTAVGSETYYTRVSADRVGGTSQTYTTTGATTAGIYSLAVTNLLQDTDAQVLEWATYFATVYATGEARVSGITCVVDSTLMSSANSQAVLGIELNDVVRVKWTPNHVGAQVDQKSVVIGVHHNIFPDRYEVVLMLGKYDSRAPFILDSATNGTLDSPGVLVF